MDVTEYTHGTEDQDSDDEAYPMGEYPPLECFIDMIASWVVPGFAKALELLLYGESSSWPL